MKQKFDETVKYYNMVLVGNDLEYGIYAENILVETCSKKWFDKSELIKIF